MQEPHKNKPRYKYWENVRIMADFTQAVKWMKEGKKVRCAKWGDENLHIYQEKNFCTFVRDHEHEKVNWLCSNEFEATDWEIYGEKEKSLSDEIGTYVQSDAINVKYVKTAVKKLKERLYEDPEACCHGVRERDAFKIIDKIFGEKLI